MSLILTERRNTHLLLIIIFSRAVSELMTTFIWTQTNYVWSLLFLCSIPLILWPTLVIISRRDSNIFLEYLPIILFLSFLLIRTNFTNKYSLKCFFSDFIVWFCYIFIIEICKRDAYSVLKLRKYMIYIAQFNIVLGGFQIAAFFFTAGFDGLFSAIDARPVTGIFDHPSTYLICILPFSLYFIKRRAYGWLFITLTTCLFTGTRGPFLAIVCMFLLFLKFVLNKPINKRDIIFSFLFIILVYSLLIKLNWADKVYTEDWTSRLNLASFSWRISHWKNFLIFDSPVYFLFGHGVGAADFILNSVYDTTKPGVLPHNDYLRLYWDIGVFGVAFFLNLVFSVIKMLYRSTNIDNDFILLTYLILICFCIADNLIYFTYPLFIFYFIASFLKMDLGTKKAVS
jgi:O-Antigen ligase